MAQTASDHRTLP